MKLDLSTGRLVTVQQQELERRVAEIRGLMKKKGACLFMAASPMKGGIRKWITGREEVGRPSEGAILIGKTGAVVTVNGSTLIPRGSIGERNYAMPLVYEGERFDGYECCEGFCADRIEAMMGTDAQEQHACVIAVANAEYLRADVFAYLKENLPYTQFVDVSEELDRIRARKSDAEIEIMKQNVRMIDKLFAGAGIYLNPLRLEREIVMDLRYAAYRVGCGGDDHLLSVPLELVSGRDGAKKEIDAVFYPGRKIEYGDRVNLKLFALGNDGYYAGMARTFVLGEPQETTRRLWRIAVQAQDYAACLLRPGRSVQEAAAAVNNFLKQEGCLEDRRSMIHGIGISVQESPQIYEDRKKDWMNPKVDAIKTAGCSGFSDCILLEESMVLYIGPTADDGIMEPISCGDIYVVGKEKTVRLTQFPRELVRLY